jgi:hypothetical protein
VTQKPEQIPNGDRVPPAPGYVIFPVPKAEIVAGDPTLPNNWTAIRSNADAAVISVEELEAVRTLVSMLADKIQANLMLSHSLARSFAAGIDASEAVEMSVRAGRSSAQLLHQLIEILPPRGSAESDRAVGQ